MEIFLKGGWTVRPCFKFSISCRKHAIAWGSKLGFPGTWFLIQSERSRVTTESRSRSRSPHGPELKFLCGTVRVVRVACSSNATQSVSVWRSQVHEYTRMLPSRLVVIVTPWHICPSYISVFFFKRGADHCVCIRLRLSSSLYELFCCAEFVYNVILVCPHPSPFLYHSNGI